MTGEAFVLNTVLGRKVSDKLGLKRFANSGEINTCIERGDIAGPKRYRKAPEGNIRGSSVSQHQSDGANERCPTDSSPSRGWIVVRRHAGSKRVLMRRHRTDLLPVLKNPAASSRRVKLRRPWPTGRNPASTLVSRIEDLVDAARQLTGVRSAYCDRVHLFGPGIGIHSECPSWMRADAAGLWKPEGTVIGNQDRTSQNTCGHRLSAFHSASQLPGSRQQVVIPLNAGRLCR